MSTAALGRKLPSACYFLLFLFCATNSAVGQTLVDNVFSTGFQGWTDINGDKSTAAKPNWGVLLTGDKPLIESSDGRVFESPTNEIGMYEPLILVNNAVTLSGDYTITASLGSVDNDGLGIVFGFVDENNYFRYGMRRQTPDNLGFPYGNSIQKVVNGQITHLYGDNFADHEADGVPINVSIQVSGNIITLTTNGFQHSPIADADLQPGKYGVHSWYGKQLNATMPEYGSMFHQISITGSTNYTTNFDDAVVAKWRRLEMVNQLGQSGNVNAMGQTVGEFAGNFKQDFLHGKIIDDTNGNFNGTDIDGNSRIDFLGPAVVIDEPGNAGWGNYVMSTRLMSNDNDGMGVLFRVGSDNNSFYRINFMNEAPSPTNVGRPARGMSMQKFDNGNWTELYSENSNPQFVYTPGVPFDLSVIAEGNTFKIGIIDNPDGAVTAINYDPIVDSNSPLLTGSVGFTNWGQGDAGFGAEFSAYGGGGTPLLTATIPNLDITIDRATGEVRLQNNGVALNIDYYELLSAAGSLNPAIGTGPNQWTPLDLAESDPVGQGWDPAGSASQFAIAEGRLLDAATIAAGANISLGQAYNSQVNAEDVRFRYRLENGMFVLGDVTYTGVAPEGLPGDFNADGIVDARDYVLWRNNLNQPEGVLSGNGDNSGIVDAGDYTVWKDHYGQTSPAALAAAQQVPEPGTWLLFGIGAAVAGMARRRRIGSHKPFYNKGSSKMTRTTVASLAVAILALTFSPAAEAVLVASYNFEGNLNDSSGNGHTGVFVGTTSIVNDPVRGLVLNVPETGNQGVNIDSVVPIPNFAANSSITIAAWYKRESSVAPTGNFRYVVDLGQNGNNPIASLGIREAGEIASYVESDEPANNGDQVNTFGTTVIEGNAATWTNWHHLAIVYDRATDEAYVYLDGVLDATNSIAALRDDYAFSWPAANIGRGPEGASSTAPGLIDDVYIFNHALTGQQIAALKDGLPTLEARVNRTTGQLEIVNTDTKPAVLTSYSITSANGAIDPSQWKSVADNWDTGGPGSIDTNPWAITSATSSLLAEEESPAVNGATLAPGQVLDLGNVWLKSPDELLAFSFVHASGLTVTTAATFTGGIGGAPYIRSDLNFDGVIDVVDFQKFVEGMAGTFTGLTQAEAYRLGDLNGNGVSDAGDFATFKNDFDAANGAGAFAALFSAQVPEPSTIGLGLLGVAALVATRLRRKAA